ncbi:fibroblast growth factor receptor-like 1 [Anopheles maculipalpis]|uniref:fibroblast growth factor receptor-like 1 n=1 Tax=Anopheles maculipalpis TaxID=1496333 RepID=UPI002158E6CB|nr:fibroblast growth factor receptor-like 1 [Anopheles maculipalpis]
MSWMPTYAKLHPGAVLFVLLLSGMLQHPALTVDSRSSTDAEIPKLQQCLAGTDTRLRCGIKEHHTDHMNSSDVQWYFKPCGGGFQHMTCSNRALLSTLEWQPLDCDNKPCRVTLALQNVSEADAGLYRCTIHPYRTDNRTQLDIQLVRTFELVVTKWPLDESIPAPELLDNLPANTTAIINTHIVLQCRVHSKVQPTIKWFRRINKPLGEHNFNQNKSIRYLENSYELLPSAGEKLLSYDVYLSKLILYNASERDIGIYVCVGINYVGVSMADAYVNLVHPNGTPVEETHGGYVGLMVLFLIPIALAFVPLVGWVVLNVLRAKQHSEEKSLVQLHGPNIYEPTYQWTNHGRKLISLEQAEHLYEKVDVV